MKTRKRTLFRRYHILVFVDTSTSSFFQSPPYVRAYQITSHSFQTMASPDENAGELVAFEILCGDGETYEVSEDQAKKVMKQSDYFRTAFSSGFAEGQTRQIKKSGWSLATAKRIINLICNQMDWNMPVGPDLALLFRAADELNMTFSTHDAYVPGSSCLEKADCLDRAFSSPLLCQNLASVICLKVHMLDGPKDFFKRLSKASDDGALVFVPVGKIKLRWNEYDDSEDPREAYGGLTTRNWESWNLLGTRAKDFSVYLARKDFPTVGQALLKVRDICYQTDGDEEAAGAAFQDRMSLVVRAGEMACGKLDAVKTELGIPSSTNCKEGFRSDSPETMYTAMEKLRSIYTTTFKNEADAAAWFSKFSIGIRIQNPSYRTIDLLLPHIKVTKQNPATGKDTLSTILRWPAMDGFLRDMATGSTTTATTSGDSGAATPLVNDHCICITNQKPFRGF